MALAVLVVFEEDKEALDFVEWIEGDVEYALGDSPVFNSATAPAVYKFPTMFHEPFETHGAKKTEAAFTMGQKWGWWVCAICKKPSRMYWDQIVKRQSSFGKNVKSMFFTEESSN
jgi:hypothetical protein